MMVLENRPFIHNGSIWTLKSGPITASIINLGASLQSLIVPDRSGKPVNVVLNYEHPEDYIRGSCFLGAVIGRYANRIKSSRFTLGNIDYCLPPNEGNNHLHGLSNKANFVAKPKDDSIEFVWQSSDGEDGFPGNLILTVTYRLKTDNALVIEYEAVCDKPTVVNITNHSYFNLAGNGTIHNHFLQLDADSYTENSAESCPTGRILSVEGTTMDFRRERALGLGLRTMPTELQMFGGYDHNLIFSGGAGFRTRGSLYCPESGIEMRLSTTQPAVQLYTGNHLEKDAAGEKHPAFSGLCLETQHFPDSPNHMDFPSTVLLPGQIYREKTQFEFNIRR